MRNAISSDDELVSEKFFWRKELAFFFFFGLSRNSSAMELKAASDRTFFMFTSSW
jgi:hypothetical protein